MNGMTIDLTSPVKEDRLSKNQSSSSSGSSSSGSFLVASDDTVAVQRGKSKVSVNENRVTSKTFVNQVRKSNNDSGNGSKASASKTGAASDSGVGILGKRMVAGASKPENDDDFMSPEKAEPPNETKRKKKTAASSSSSSSLSSSSSSSTNHSKGGGGTAKARNVVKSLSSDPYKVINNQTEIIKKAIGTKNISNIPDPRARLQFLMDSLSKISESQNMLSVVEQKIRTEMKKASKLQLAQSAKGPLNIVTEKEAINEEIVASLFPKLSESELASTKDWWNKTSLQENIEHSDNSVVLSVQRGYNPDGTALPASPPIATEAKGKEEAEEAEEAEKAEEAEAMDPLPPPPPVPAVPMVDKATNTSPQVMSLLDSSQSQSQSQSHSQAQSLSQAQVPTQTETETEDEGSHIARRVKPRSGSVTVDLLGSSEESDAPHVLDGVDSVAKNDALEQSGDPSLVAMKYGAEGNYAEQEDEQYADDEEEEVEDDVGLTQSDSQMEAIMDLLVRDYPMVYQKILLFHPVPLDELHACVKGRVRIGKEALKKLMAQHHVFIAQSRSTSSSSQGHKNLNGAKYRQWSK